MLMEIATTIYILGVLNEISLNNLGRSSNNSSVNNTLVSSAHFLHYRVS